ncbi:hypothetical protein TSUD_281220 [Trifolium subterraneum]|uniref:RNase H type-1 domain-containing protein n=1 Tax=Trifolium subterraneum TaxID=3900 RepID=A0A2Z6PI91_TRISU|nr:hypothetical protein TSUD_281220 [Trifolium subterraneum]
MNPLSSSTPPRIVEPLKQDNCCQQLPLHSRSYPASLSYRAAHHGPLGRPLAQRWGQLYKPSLTGEQDHGPGTSSRAAEATQLGKYDGLTDPDIHIQNIDAILNYQAVKGGIKCRIFPTTLVEGAMAWYRSLPQGSITSWKDLCKQFTSHFTASRKHPKTEANLEAVRQGPNETLRSYIERFNKEAVQVDVTDDMKKYMMRKNLRDGTKFKEMVAIEKPATWDEILHKAQAYMQFEEETMADAMRHPRAEHNRPPREQGNKNGDRRNRDRRGRDKSREPRGPPSQFTNYTSLLVPREIVLAECAASDFKNAGIRFPKSTPFKPGQDRSRYCAYHKSYGHLTEDCIQLKDAIEILIRNGKLKDYVKRKENPRQEKKREDTPEDEPRASGEKNVALAVWRPEDFYVPKHLKDAYEHPILNEWENFAETMVISGGVFDKHTVGSVKRKFEELITASSGMAVTLGKPKTSSQPLSFYLEELPGGSANSQIPLLVRADMANFDVRRILVDSGSSCDIMYAHLFRTLQLDESHLTPYLGSDLQGFNGATTKPWGYNQIPMAVADRTKTAFMTESGNYYYNVMPFGLKNAGATYQRMMNKVFRGEIGDMLELKVNMRFNPEKCTFGIRAGKFLGFYLTERGIEANPDKCRAFTEFPTPNNKKSIQTLNGMLTALSRFECEQALQHLKKALSEHPVLSRPNFGEVLYLYLAVASEAVSATLIRETLEGQKPVYFTSKALQGPELRYQRIEKVALALVTAAKRLRYYFLAHTVVIRTDQPIKSLLVRPDMAGRMLKWSLGLSEFDIRYESRKALKAQVLADFVAEMTCSPSSTDGVNKWTIFVDGASNATGAGAGIILENDEGILIEVSLALSFPTSKNQAEYEAFLAGLRLAEDVGAKEIKIFTDSQLVASQVLGEYQAKNDNLSEYLALVKERLTKFDSVEIQHVPREHNKRADILSKLASTKRKNGNKSVIQEILSHPSIQKPTRVLDINAIGDANCWMTPVYNYLAHGTLPNDEKEAATVKRRACSYTLLDDKLYRRSFSIPLLKCADEATADYILREIHEGINSQHLGGRSLARKALRAGYYWPTMQKDAKEHVKKCDKCQRHGDMHLAPPHELNLMLRRNAKDSHEGKLTANWEGPYRVRGKTYNGAYHLETLQGKEIPRTWNAQKPNQNKNNLMITFALAFLLADVGHILFLVLLDLFLFLLLHLFVLLGDDDLPVLHLPQHARSLGDQPGIDNLQLGDGVLEDILGTLKNLSHLCPDFTHELCSGSQTPNMLRLILSRDHHLQRLQLLLDSLLLLPLPSTTDFQPGHLLLQGSNLVLGFPEVGSKVSVIFLLALQVRNSVPELGHLGIN